MNTEDLQQKLDALTKEAAELRAWLNSIDDEIKVKRERLRTLEGGRDSYGEIQFLKWKIRDAEFPIFTYDQWGGNLRVIDVTSQFISVRHDKSDDIRRYRVSDGIRERCRAGRYADRIDIQKAIQIWNEHKAKTQ
jgi:hypothetical protein